MNEKIITSDVREWVISKYQEHRSRILKTQMLPTHKDRMLDELDEICHVINMAITDLESNSMTEIEDTIH